MADQTLAALRELTEAVMAEFFGNDTNLSKRLIKATNEAQLVLMVQPPDDDLANHPSPAEPATPIDLDALLSPAGPYETGPDAHMADGAQLVWDRHGVYPTWWAPVSGCDSLGILLARIRSRILPYLRPPANHFPGATEMVAPPAEGEVHLLAAWMYRLADERTRNRRRGIRPHPSALTRTGAVIQQQAAVIQQQAAELAELAECREALRRVRRWGSTFGSPYSSAVAMGVMDWIDAGMTGPLPAMPEYLEDRPNG